MDLYSFREPFSACSHAAGMVLALPATAILWGRSRGDPAKRACLVVFGLSLAACYAGSALFHGVRGPAERIATFARIDLIGIYLLIAGTYTPPAWGLLRGRRRRLTLATVWSVAGAATGLLASGTTIPLPVSTAVYLAMGWGSLVCFAEIRRVAPPRALRPLVAGGLLYSVGAVINLLGRPAPWPGVVGAHGVFHLFVLAGSAAHFYFMLTVVVPFTGPAEDAVDRLVAEAMAPPRRRWARPPVEAGSTTWSSSPGA